MPDTPLQQLAAARPERVDRLPLAPVRRRTATSQASSREGVDGVTSNPTIFQAAIAEGDAYDEQLREVLKTETEPKEVFLALAVDDIRDACDILRPVWDEAGENARDGWVSLEVDPNLAHDTRGARSPRPSACTRSSTGPTCSSRSPRPRRACPRSRRRSPPASRST